MRRSSALGRLVKVANTSIAEHPQCLKFNRYGTRQFDKTVNAVPLWYGARARSASSGILSGVVRDTTALPPVIVFSADPIGGDDNSAIATSNSFVVIARRGYSGTWGWGSLPTHPVFWAPALSYVPFNSLVIGGGTYVKDDVPLIEWDDANEQGWGNSRPATFIQIKSSMQAKGFNVFCIGDEITEEFLDTVIPKHYAGAGGGASVVADGGNAATTKAGDGAEGLHTNFSGEWEYLGAGGGGASTGDTPGAGGSQIGGNGASFGHPATDGFPGTGSGGGGGLHTFTAAVGGTTVYPITQDVTFHQNRGFGSKGRAYVRYDADSDIIATGGTETTVEISGVVYRVHTFLKSDIFNVVENPSDVLVECLLVGRGGDGGAVGSESGSRAGESGGGAGGNILVFSHLFGEGGHNVIIDDDTYIGDSPIAERGEDGDSSAIRGAYEPGDTDFVLANGGDSPDGTHVGGAGFRKGGEFVNHRFFYFKCFPKPTTWGPEYRSLDRNCVDCTRYRAHKFDCSSNFVAYPHRIEPVEFYTDNKMHGMHEYYFKHTWENTLNGMVVDVLKSAVMPSTSSIVDPGDCVYEHSITWNWYGWQYNSPAKFRGFSDTAPVQSWGPPVVNYSFDVWYPDGGPLSCDYVIFTRTLDVPLLPDPPMVYMWDAYRYMEVYKNPTQCSEPTWDYDSGWDVWDMGGYEDCYGAEYENYDQWICSEDTYDWYDSENNTWEVYVYCSCTYVSSYSSTPGTPTAGSAVSWGSSITASHSLSYLGNRQWSLAINFNVSWGNDPCVEPGEVTVSLSNGDTYTGDSPAVFEFCHLSASYLSYSITASAGNTSRGGCFGYTTSGHQAYSGALPYRGSPSANDIVRLTREVASSATITTSTTSGAGYLSRILPGSIISSAESILLTINIPANLYELDSEDEVTIWYTTHGGHGGFTGNTQAGLMALADPRPTVRNANSANPPTFKCNNTYPCFDPTLQSGFEYSLVDTPAYIDPNPFYSGAHTYTAPIVIDRSMTFRYCGFRKYPKAPDCSEIQRQYISEVYTIYFKIG